MDVMTAMAAASKAIELAKLLNSIDRDFDKAELKARAADLLSALADVKIALVEAKDELAEKDSEIAKLKDRFALREESKRIGAYLYAVDDKDHPHGWPFCPRCEQVDGRMIHLVQDARKAGLVYTMCPQCKAEYRDAQHRSTPRGG